jgi:hypothetical protein
MGQVELETKFGWSADTYADATQYNLLVRRTNEVALEQNSVIDFYQKNLYEELARNRLDVVLQAQSASYEKALVQARDILLSSTNNSRRQVDIKGKFDPLIADAKRIERAQAIELRRTPLQSEEEILNLVYSRGLEAHERLASIFATFESDSQKLLRKQFGFSSADLNTLAKNWGINDDYLSKADFDRTFRQIFDEPTNTTPINPTQWTRYWS